MIGYKIHSEENDYKILYETEKIYTFNGNLNCFINGFRFYEDISNMFSLCIYGLKAGNFKIYEVEILGEAITKHESYSITNKIKVIKEFDKVGDYVKFDKNGNVIGLANDSNFKREYNDKNNLIYEKNGEHEYWYEYDDKKIHFKDNTGFEYWCEVDENGNTINYKNSKGFEFYKRFDENNNLIYHKDNEYLEEETFCYLYNKDKKIIYSKCKTRADDNYEEWFKYDDNGNLIHYRDSDNYEFWYNYDDRGNQINYQCNDGKKWSITIT